ncbi:ABC transporter permease [Priestia filamentosa]|uniref:Permease n=1 Tax=Priestia filamentosa TaxID=1402861 RepID=A0A1X7FPW2_9BACI|nr:ABC transporter permease [Priestia filamentosa]AKO94626.1 permease [Priestia filamentosa]MDT3764934.1 ABC transporter permease [Priestia filamentosa]OXS66650.1 permease [Priestia filamentosa]WCM15528.1 ABC transporter permease [Priestia filamentosa]WRU95255.1 ABC transporter permease [Priestia filamentosa]
MYKALLQAEFLKIKRKWIWGLVFLGPFGVIALQAVNFGIRYDYLTDLYKDDLWDGLLKNISSLSVFALMFGATLLASLISSLEHQSTSWKHLLALPLSKTKIFIGKFALVFILLTVSCILLAIGSIILGISLNYGNDIPLVNLLKTCFYPYLASLPIVALQLWLSVVFNNQALPLFIGIVGSIFGSALPRWTIWSWPSLSNQWDKPIINVCLGIIVGLILLWISTIHFTRKDVNS